MFLFFSCAFRYHAIHKEVYDWFDISFDKFGRTSTPEQTEVCQAIFNKLFENNYLSENTMQQVNDFPQMPVSLICSLDWVFKSLVFVAHSLFSFTAIHATSS